MVNIKIFKKYDDTCVADITVTDRITIIAGDSATGKTKICSMLEERDSSAFRVDARDSRGNETKVYYCSNIDRLSEVTYDKSKDMSVVVIDEYVATALDKLENNSLRGQIDKTEKYFIIFQRDSVIKMHIGINSVLHVTYKNKQYHFENPLRFNDEYELGNITKCTNIIMEDSESGYKIMKHYFDSDKIHVIHSNGNGDIHKCLVDIPNGESTICGLDYDKGSWALYHINELINNNTLNRANIYFIRMESFEEVLCNSELVLSKCNKMRDFVENMDKHMDCTFKHRGEYFLTILKQYFITENGKPKYRKNSFSCFTKSCTTCSNTSCKFRNNTDNKAEIVFSNKYKILYKLHKYFQNH